MLESVMGQFFRAAHDAEMFLHAVCLSFANGSRYTFQCSSDGENLDIRSQPLEVYQMGGFGEVVVSDLAKEQAWKQAIGMTLSSAEIVEGSDGQVGVQLGFHSGPVFMYNLGDSLYVTTKSLAIL